jgi:selenocysteine lyase/cysteine desulfurase
MLGSMAVVRLPGRHPATPAAAQEVHDRLWQKYHIEVPVMSLGPALWTRVSAQIYNDLEDYEQFAAVVAAA